MTGNRYPELTFVFSSIFYNNCGQSRRPKQEAKQDVEKYENISFKKILKK